MKSLLFIKVYFVEKQTFRLKLINIDLLSKCIYHSTKTIGGRNMQVSFHDIGELETDELKYVVIVAKKDDKLILSKHRKRTTWEIPGGHIEAGENPDDAAKRELNEETGAKLFKIEAICDYGVSRNSNISYGRLYFANVSEIGPLPELEIEKIELFEGLPLDNMTYPDIQPKLYDRIMQAKK